MSSSSLRPSSLWRRSGSLLIAALTLTVSSFLATSCLTPDFKFDDRPSGGEGGTPATSAHCENRKKDADEADTDCGGIDCSACALGRACNANSDCVNESCTNGKCQDPSCTDDVKNSGETDLDCGGDNCAPCGDGKKCADAKDCESDVCKGGTCAAGSCSDRVKNQGEADIDCGGPCPLCDVGGACVIDDDCAAPPEGDLATTLCEDGKCKLLCASGTADCNAKAVDGCEINTNTDVDHCGACAEKCAPTNAVAGKCNGGACEIDFDPGKGCKAGYGDCDGNPETGCEINLNTDEENCGACNDACSTANGTPTCTTGACTIACATDFANCDGKARENGCEVNKTSDSKNCNGCNNVCQPDNVGDSPFCADSTCGSTPCPNGMGDCDGNTTCTDALTTITNCGGCGNACSVANGSATCTSGSCAILSCTGSNRDCNTTYSDGCEADILVSKSHCGGCAGAGGTDCNALKNNAALHIAAINCDAGDCLISSCSSNYADCDGDSSNGCEVNTQSDDGRCGGCLGTDANPASGVDCTKEWANGNGNCNAGTCEFVDCTTNFGDCANGLADGCETDLRSAKDNCGACGIACQTNSVTSTNNCSNKVCTPACSGAGQNCDANPVNGCEDKNSDEQNCGTCGVVCSTDSVTSGNTCTSGSCVPACTGAGAACDANGANGCEDTDVDASHCGACGVVCSTAAGAHVTANTCDGSGSCDPTCATNYLSCDADGTNGCEIDKRTNSTHCGACGVRCGGDGQANVSGTPSCASSVCSVSCTSGLCPNTADPEKPCTLSLGTTLNCTVCGEVCSGTTPFCSAGGCINHLPIVKVNDSTTKVTSSNDTTISHVLETSGATNPYRAVVLILGNTSNTRSPDSAPTYDGKAMTLALAKDSGNQSWTGIYYILNANLPASAKTATLSIDGNNFNSQDWTARVIEFTNIDQSTALGGTASAGGGGSACGNAGGISVTTNADAFVISALVEQNATATGVAVDGQTPWTALVQNDTAMTHGYVADAAAGSTLVRWTCTDSEWAHVLISLNAEGTGP